MKNIYTFLQNLLRIPLEWGRLGWYQKILCILGVVLIVFVAHIYVIAWWYISSVDHKPYKQGVSFIAPYASSLGVEPKETLDALINLDIKHFRLVSYWNAMEPEPRKYDFSELDWQFQKIEEAGGKVTLTVGLRQPRWPECHMPTWASAQPPEQWKPQLENFVTAVVNRYKVSPALDSYQIENEYFLKGFGNCETIPGAMDRSRLVSEYNLVKQLDPEHKAIINRSNNALGWPVGEPTPDEFGISIYRRVWDAQITKRYLQYPFPAWFYAYVAGWQKIMTGRDMIIHEFQAEAWAPNNKSLTEISLEEQNKSFNAERFDGRFDYAKQTGMREVYFWGAEYWYYRKAVLGDNTVWQVAEERFKQL